MDNSFTVGPWLAQPSRNSLALNGKTLHLEPKVMEVLVCLAGQAGETVAKDRLLEAVWPDTFVTDDVLTRCISELRRAFADDPRQAQFIETIPKRGYRLIAAVTRANGDIRAKALEVPTAPPASLQAKPLPNPRLKIAAVGLLALTGVAILAGASWRIPVVLGTPKITSLAVLPLRNLSTDPNQEYFSDGMTDALTTELSQISSIRVISRTSANLYGKSSKSVSQIAQELGVDGIVEGTVQRSGDSVRVTAQLIYAPEDRHVWAKSYERDSQNILALEEDVARAIADDIRATLVPRERARLTRSSWDLLRDDRRFQNVVHRVALP